MAIRVFHRDQPDLMLPMISKDARLVVWPGVGAHTANMAYVRLEPGERNVPHIHAESEDVIFILEGEGSVTDFDHDRRLEFGRDQVAMVDVTFFGDQRTGELVGPSEAYAADKAEFGSSRINRWFGREWSAT